MAHDEAYLEAEKKIEEARLSKIRSLYLFDMNLTKIPDTLTELTELEVLSLSGNNLTELPDGFGQLTQLTRLIRLSRN